MIKVKNTPKYEGKSWLVVFLIKRVITINVRKFEIYLEIS